MPFEDSRRITGPHLLLAGPGALLETSGPHARDLAAHARWADQVRRAAAALGWAAPEPISRRHASGATLAFRADMDQLFVATEVNEWAWCVAIDDHGFHAPGYPSTHDHEQAMGVLHRLSRAERQPALMALLDAAQAHQLPALLDDDALTIGLGAKSHTWPLPALPDLDTVPWHALGRIPTAMITGSNGKTTTVRLIAAMLRAHGLTTGHSCTDGLFIANDILDSGDYSGPAGARRVLRDRRVEAAVLETARGGMLRRGLALADADVAVITNVSADHFGEYGIHDLDDLAAAKFNLSRSVQARGRLVLNADDARLRAAGAARPRTDWFTLDLERTLATLPQHDDTRLCGLRDGTLWWHEGGRDTAVLPVGDVAISLGGRASYNLANAAAAVTAARALGIGLPEIRGVLRHFGLTHADNPGRLQRWTLGGVEVLLDYAHNPEGLDGLLQIAQQIRGGGRLALLLGQAGNRDNEQIRALARVAARHRPDLVVLKDLDGYLRGRTAGEVTGLLRRELLLSGLPEQALPIHLREFDAARAALAWARAGDVLVLPVHALAAKKAVSALLEDLATRGWNAGNPLPADAN